MTTSTANGETAIAIQPDDTPHVLFAAPDGLLHYSTRGSSGWRTEPLRRAVHPDARPAVAVDAAGQVHLCATGPEGLIYGTGGFGRWRLDSPVPSARGCVLALDGQGRPYMVTYNPETQEVLYVRPHP